MAKLITPEIFQKNTAEDYLKAAIDTAEWIDTLAIKTEYGRIWQALPEGQDGYREDVPLFTPKSMYDGSAGIGIFFIRLYEATGDTRWLTEAEEAAAHIISTKVGVEWYQTTLHSEVKGIIPVPGWAAGPYNGPVGEAYFLEDLYQVTGKQEYRDYVLYVADVLLEAAVTDERGLHWSDQEDITADGGFIVFLDILYRKTGIKKYLDTACAAADRIAQDALPAPNGGKFWKLLDLSMIDFAKDTTFPNWSHGTTGTAWMFAALYQDTKKEEYLELAKEGLIYAMNIAVGDETGRLIPYQDHPVTGPTYDNIISVHVMARLEVRWHFVNCMRLPERRSTGTGRSNYRVVSSVLVRRRNIPGASGTASASAVEQQVFWSILLPCMNIPGRKSSMII